VPYTWLGFSTASRPIVQDKTPIQLRDEVAALVEQSGGTLLELYFDVGREVAYALIKDLGGSIDTKRVSRELGGVKYTKLLDAEQAEGAIHSAAP
jgi:hypothetical protein